MTSIRTTNPAATTAPRAAVHPSIISERVWHVITSVSEQHYLLLLALRIVWASLSALGRFAELLASWKQPGVPVPAVESLPTIEHPGCPPKTLLLLEKAEPPDDHPNLRTSRADLIDGSASISDSSSPGEKTPPDVSSMPSRVEVTSANAEAASLSQQMIPRAHIVAPVARVPDIHARTGPATVNPSPPSPPTEWTPFIPAGASKGGYIKKRSHTPDFCGGFSDVFRAEIRFRAPAAGPELMQDFALKILRRVGLDGKEEHQMITSMNKRLSQEVITWAGLVHPNIVPLVGFTIAGLPSLISPWYEEGNIRSYLNLNPRANRWKLIYGVAQGLEYLHSQSPSIAHGDIKPENVLINKQGDALLSDLGLATYLGDECWYTASHHEGGSYRYMAPELFLGEPRTCSADVYSFASLAFEVFTGHLPHSSLKNINLILLSMINSKGQEYPVDDWSKFPELNPIEDILRGCWSRRPEDRPSMKDIVEKLSILVRGSDA